MAKKPPSKKPVKKRVIELVRIPGSARRYKDKKTGKQYSRYSATKILKEQGKIKQKLVSLKTKRRFKTYISLRNDYISKLQQKGKFVSVRQAMNSDELKQILKDLKKGANLRKQGKKIEGDRLIKAALKKTTRRDGVADFIPPGESP